MPPSLLFHIGDPKTGSTSIQRTLFDGTWDCPTRSLASPPSLSAYKLANAIRGDLDHEEIATQFTALARWARKSEADVLVVSAEQFSSVRPQVLLEAVETFLPNLAPEMRVVAYVRPHVGRFLSAYSQRTKVGTQFGDLLDFFKYLYRNGESNYHGRFTKWRKTFAERFTLRPMVRDKLVDGDVVTDFLTLALQDAPFTLTAKSLTNLSMAIEPLSGLRTVQKRLLESGIGQGTRHIVGSTLNSLVQAQGSAKGTRLRINKRLLNRVRRYEVADAKRLDLDFFGGPVMVPALDLDESDLAEEVMDADASRYFFPERIAAMEQHGDALARLLGDRPYVWEQAYRRRIGQAPPLREDEALSLDDEAHNQRVDDVVAEILRLISP